jgi:hypothetical protein
VFQNLNLLVCVRDWFLLLNFCNENYLNWRFFLLELDLDGLDFWLYLLYDNIFLGL